MRYKYHSMTFRKSQLQKQTNEKEKLVNTPEWNENGGTVGGGRMISAAMMLKGRLAYRIIGIHKRRQIHYIAFWLYMQKKKKSKQKPTRTRTHARAKEKKKKIQHFPVKGLQISVWSVS